jgi:hypothetical protein
VVSRPNPRSRVGLESTPLSFSRTPSGGCRCPRCDSGSSPKPASSWRKWWTKRTDAVPVSAESGGSLRRQPIRFPLRVPFPEPIMRTSSGVGVEPQGNPPRALHLPRAVHGRWKAPGFPTGTRHGASGLEAFLAELKRKGESPYGYGWLRDSQLLRVHISPRDPYGSSHSHMKTIGGRADGGASDEDILE